MSEAIEVKSEKLKIDIYDSAYVIPGKQGILHVYDKQGEFVPFTSKRRFNRNEYSVPVSPISVEETEMEYYDEEVVYIGFLRGHWGHFLVDSSVRLWALDLPECVGKRILVKIEGMEEFYSKLFTLLHVDQSRILQLNKGARFRKVLVPELSYFPGKYITKDFLTPFKKISDNIFMNKAVYEKIYLSRVHFAKGKKELGEELIQKIFEENGFHILYPEELSYEEQVWYYKNCKKMVTTNGTIAHNVVYADKDVELTILKRFEEDNIHQDAINNVMSVKAQYINAYDKRSDHDNCLMVRTPELLEFCRKENMIIPRESYWKRFVDYWLFRLPYLYRWCK